MKFLDKILDEKSDSELSFFWQIVGPLFILCTFALEPNNFFIFSVGVLGLFLSARWQMTGLLYSVILLVLASAAEHFFFDNKHIWLIGIEGSYAIAFYITALNAERHSHFVQSLFSQIDAKTSSILNLEEECTKSKESATSQQIHLQEKVDALQLRLDEVLTEHSSLLILNEVLRKTAARESADKDLLRGDLFELQSRLASCQSEEEELRKELSRLKNSSALVLENSKLMDEINTARLEKEQTHMINETLARLHAKESMRAQSACEQVSILERNKDEAALQISEFEKKVRDLQSQLAESVALGERYKLTAEKNEAIQTERNFLKDRLRQAEFELAQRHEMAPLKAAAENVQPIPVPEVDLSQYVPKEEVDRLHEQMRALSQVESLYKQLKKQFEEKNETLHKTRVDLFHVDNALQTLKIEIERKEIATNPIPEEVVSEVVELEDKLSCLQEENQELLNLVSHLSFLPPQEASKRKKKVKVTPEQEMLF